MHPIPLDRLPEVDLYVDAVYKGARDGHAGDDPLPRLLSISTGGGFRYRGNLDQLELVVLTSTLRDPDWPDSLDPETGVYTYYGDNKKHARDLHKTPRKGNEILKRLFQWAHSSPETRRNVPPVLVFAKAGGYRDVRFLGLAVPGTADLRASEDLVAVWKVTGETRFQNYRARFTVLDVPCLTRAWINNIIAGDPHTSNAPAIWRQWIETGQARALTAARSIEYRTKAEQLPKSDADAAILRTIRRYFRPHYHGFEHCAASLARLLLPDIASLDVTRPARDGGRDAIGQLRIGRGPSAIYIDFALEAKCYDSSTGVGVRDVSRLVSRLRHRQFGILVTTSYVNVQAYREIKEDGHPVVFIVGADILELLRRNNLGDSFSVRTWLERNFPPGR
ncbi:MAG: restriction endonuclease [Proteobacteria bacterium]|nr:restriction endonuclease [Pseudomonadota bacterium]